MKYYDENFLEKNKTCQNVFTKQNDDDYVRCRKRNGLYEYEKYMKKSSRRFGIDD